ncbi:MAG: nucleotidyl transferase AbiEii/AbiGii toxin family protein [Olsenella sp.]
MITGDEIVPDRISRSHGVPLSLMFEESPVQVQGRARAAVLHGCALAEKLETVVTRGIANTRGRDYYDIHILVRLKSEEVDRQPLHEAVVATTSSEARSRRWLATQRHSRRSEYRESCEAWTSYIVGSPYAAGPDFDEIVGSTFESCSSS